MSLTHDVSHHREQAIANCQALFEDAEINIVTLKLGPPSRGWAQHYSAEVRRNNEVCIRVLGAGSSDDALFKLMKVTEEKLGKKSRGEDYLTNPKTAEQLLSEIMRPPFRGKREKRE